jgi:hypothetical protein
MKWGNAMRKSSVNNSFFVEMIIAILFFSICVAVTIQFFVSAHLNSEQSKEVNLAMIQLQNEAEEIKSMSSFKDVQKHYQTYEMQTGNKEEHIYQIPLDKDWVVSTANPKYYLEIRLSPQKKAAGNLMNATLIAFQLDENNKRNVLGRLDICRYFNQ